MLINLSAIPPWEGGLTEGFIENAKERETEGHLIGRAEPTPV